MSGRVGGLGRSAGRNAQGTHGRRAGQPSKEPSLTSSATDEDFYSSLAQMAGDNLDDDGDNSSLSEADAKKMADSLAGMDDLDSDLFGSSLKKSSPRTPEKATPTKPSTLKQSTPKPDAKKLPDKVEASETPKENTPRTNKPGVKPATKPSKKFDIGKFDDLGFDEDDPLAGLLSDDEDTAPKPKPKKTAKPVKPDVKPAKPEPDPVVEPPKPAEVERPRTSHGRRQPSPDPGVSSPPVTPEKGPGRRRDAVSPDLSSVSTEEAKPAAKPSSRGRQPASKPKEEINFDSDDDLPGLDGGTPRDTPTPPSRGKHPEHKPEPDLFGDDGLLGLDDDKPTLSKDTPSSRFSQLLGGKSKDEPKKQKPKSLDDFMSNISTKSPESKQPAGKKAVSPTSEDSFLFGGYMPSAATGQGRSRTEMGRPDTAPGSGRRSVRFADELGLGDDDIFGSARPKTAPNRSRPAPDSQTTGRQKDSIMDDITSPRRSSPRRGLGDNANKETQKKQPDTSPKTDKKPGGGGSGGGDWLGLGDGDTGLELPFTLPKPAKQASTPAKPVQQAETKAETKQPEPDLSARQGRTSPEDTPARLRRRASKESDDFLKMLGITPDEAAKPDQKQSKLPWETGARKGRRWQEQSSSEGGSLDLGSSERGSLDLGSSGRISPAPRGDSRTKEHDTNMAESSRLQKQQQQQQPSTVSPTQQASTELSLSHTTTRDGPKVQPQTTPKQVQQSNAVRQPQDTQQTFSQGPSVQGPQALERIQPQTPASAAPGIPQNLSTPSYVPVAPTQGQYQDPRSISVAPPQAFPSPIPQGTHTDWQVRTEHRAEPDVNMTQMQAEMAQLMQRLQLAESSNQGRLVQDAGYNAQLEAKVRHLELERDQLQASLDSMKQRHQTELSNIDISHKAHVKTLEESYLRREVRINEETDLQISHYTERLRVMEQEAAENQAAQARKIQLLENRWTSENERLRDLHRKALDEARREHDDEMDHLRKLKEQEVTAAASAHAHTKSLQSLMQQVMNSTRDVSDMRYQIEASHKTGMEEREVAARARDEYLKQMQERLVKQQAENEEERTRLQGLIAKMELHIREQTRQLDQEKWRLAQEESRVKALQGSLEDERRMTMEQLAVDRVEVQRAREELLREQQRVTSQLQEERRALSMERAQLSSTQREILSREKLKTDTSIQAEADLEVTAAGIKQDAAALGVRQAQLKQEESKLAREKQELEHKRDAFEEEKTRVEKLSLEVQKRSQEIGELCTEAAQAREQGDQALSLAEQLRAETNNDRAEIENQLIVLQQKERQLAEDRVAIAHERRLLEMDKKAGRCRQCADRQVTPSPHTDYTVNNSPSSFTVGSANLSQSPHRPSRTPDLLINSLELKRTLRRWSNDKEKDEEFLQQESRFLSQLQRSRDTIRSRQSVSSSPSH